MIRVDTSDAFRVAARLNKVPLRLYPRLISTTRRYGGTLLTTVLRNASTGNHAPGAPHIPGTGPGPNAATGDYRRSWTPPQIDVSGAGVSATIGTNAPQARRLEHGFVGADSLGRVYNQPPYPHAQPALDEVGPNYVLALATDLKEVIDL